MTLDQASKAFEANPCYPTAKAYGIIAAEYAEDQKVGRDELTKILAELEAWLKGTKA